ncbi:MAG TPA: ankyrin repeat domain-containing protein, partial [Tepidisphaeraceae bacterium]|nr:ankyrin repeat domain-containing protein [Tepidisphaeraceae bacterium]
VAREDLNYTLELVMTSEPARAQGLQLQLMRLLLARGAAVQPRAIQMTLGHAIHEPVVMLIDEGHLPLTASSAAGLGRLDDLVRLLPDVDPAELHAALSLAVINRQVECAARCLDAGADANAFLIVHAHSTPLHQAAINADVPMLQLLLARGARLDIRDTLWHGTPLDWARHGGHSQIAEMLTA